MQYLMSLSFQSARFRKTKWITHESYPWLVLDVPEFDWNACYNGQCLFMMRLFSIVQMITMRMTQMIGHRGWRSLTLHGLGKHVSQHWDSKDVREAGYVYENEQEARKAYHWTEIADKCPKTVEMIKSIPGYQAFDRVRYMYLEPRGFITPHKDMEHNKLDH